MDLVSILVSLGIGAVAGWLACLVTNSKSGLLKNIILGLVGGFVGQFICRLLHISFAGIVGTIVVSAAGAVLVVFIINKLFK